jgi:hypothetical protein
MGALTHGMLFQSRSFDRLTGRNSQLGGRDSNPDSQDQNLMSCHWTTPQGV